MANRWRSFVLIPSFVVFCSIVGGIYGPGVQGVSAAEGEDAIKSSLREFTEIYRLVEVNSADPLDPDKAIYKGAIPGMLHTLDPHSSFFDPRDFQILREDQKGAYFGVGMTVAPRSGKTIVVAPFKGSPAYRAGIRPGDVIIEVDDTRTDKLSTTEVADLLKGPRGTAVKVTIGRPGHEQPLVFNIIRDDIKRHVVSDAFWLRPGIAYLKIDSFNENTSQEMMDQLDKLGEKNIQGLVLDLRENPGGLLNEGVAVASHFLRKNQLVVSHRGRSSAEKPYLVNRGSSKYEYPIVVLVNRYSASAAEIVTGALQDHDRAWVLGDTTFGKGLVQTVYPLSEETGLALTTAKYYTPSGRLIQRDYSKGSFYDYYFRKEADTKNLDDVKMTDGGRTVYGGGGITPDEKFVETYNQFQTEVLRKYGFFNFVARYFGNRDTKLPADWSPDDAFLKDFQDYLDKAKITYTEQEWKDNEPWVRRMLKHEVYITAFSVEDAQKEGIQTDPMVAKAVEAMPKARALLERTQKLLVQRMDHSRN